MPFVNAKCPNCGGALQVDNGKRAAICPFCKEAYIVEDAIKNYVTNYNTNIEHLHADVVNISSQKDFEIRAGELVAYRGESVDVIIPSNVHMIGRAFAGCSQLKSVFIPNTVTAIGWEAFLGCSSLTSIQIPNSVKTIGKSFMYCSSLRTVTIPDSVTEIVSDAFYGCPIETIIASEKWKMEHCRLFPEVLDSYCKESRKLELRATLLKHKKQLEEYEDQYRRTGLFAKNEKKRLLSSIKIEEDQISFYQRQISDLEQHGILSYSYLSNGSVVD